jgi:hypothetical protein
MPTVNFSISRDADLLNTITFSGYGTSFTLGPNGGSASYNLVSGGIYSLSAGSNGGNPRLQVLNASCIGLEDRDDNDFNDLIVCAGSGSFLNDSQYQAPWDPVSINVFTVSPNPQTSGADGNPDYDVTLNWNTTAAVSVSINQGIGGVAGSGGVLVNTGLQSVAGSNSPATKTYTLTAVGGGGDTQTAQVTAVVYNDNDPGPFTIPNQTNLEPNTAYSVFVRTVSSSVIDMITNVSGTNGATVSTNNSSWSSNISISPGDSVYVRFFSVAFNQDPNGLTNSRTYGVNIGPRSANFTATTRAPDVNETFNYSDKSDNLPYPDIDTIASPSPSQYITTNTLTVDDIELQNPSGVEIKTNNGNAEIRVKVSGSSTWGSWTNTRSI